jgi:hypothetical protein
MRSRLAAAAAGAILIAAAIAAFSLSSHPVIAGTNAVEPVQPTAWESDTSPRCHTLSRVPPGAGRLRILITLATGGARDLHVEIVDAARRPISAGDLHGVQLGENVIKLSPKTRAAHAANLCLSNPGTGQIVVAGEDKRVGGAPKGKESATAKEGVPSAIFLKPGSSSWAGQTGTIADRYANAQAGATGGWSLWVAALFAAGAAVLALWSMVALPGRRS